MIATTIRINKEDQEKIKKIFSLDENDKLPLLGKSDLEKINRQDLSIFCNLGGYYQVPSIELISFLKELIPDTSKAIEIASGSGNIGYHLGLRMTDSYQQKDDFETALYYKAMGIEPVPYGKDVEKLDAISAIKKYKPEIVLGCWATHLYEENLHYLGGNKDGIAEHLFPAFGVKKYIFVGNENTHKTKPLLNVYNRVIKNLKIHKADWLYSRSMAFDKNFILEIDF